MIRITVALLIVCAAAAVAALAPDLRIVAVLVGGLAAVLVSATGAPDDRSHSPQPAAAATPVSEQAVIDAIAEPVLLVVDGRVRIANAAARALLGGHVIGEDVRLAIRHPAAAERLGAGGADGATELIGLGGRDQRVEMQVATIAPGRRLVHLIDRTTSHAAERARVDFVANSSHELRTPLAAIIGFIETLDDEKAGADAEVRNRFLSVMMKEARRMQRLIDDLISLSRIEAEKYRLPEMPVALGRLVEEVAADLRDSDEAARADLTLDLAPDVPMVAGDAAQLAQVLHNLVGNALKYGKRGTPVTIALRRDGDTLIRLSVTDQGEGIAAEHLPRLTERFYRVDPGRSRAQGGTGLGLAIVKHIVERHRGRLDIASAPGVGTTVSILLPPAAHPAILPTAAPDAVTIVSPN
ncbi:cell wall metabolism sensor histidine kinase WalK [Sphingomonas sp. SUN039]|uniref:sensor histidine kinase n=1 Tax=Sphingomonas sp. SUN039 TaxID=2937787 RepID=UPI002164665F|nr:ATP-binding protein [Sphingomonas sp. SUN039]UVO54083.1 ATP-binding protein [Sphingomonas sp. SUN039]